MTQQSRNPITEWRPQLERLWPWALGLGAFLWVLFRSGTNPRRLAYPCQRAALPLAGTWALGTVAFFGAHLAGRRVAKTSAIAAGVIAVVWIAAVLWWPTRAKPAPDLDLPLWEVDQPVSTVFVIEDIPATSGSLAAGDSSVPDAHLPDPAIDTLFDMMKQKGIYLHKTDTTPTGIVGADDVVIIKGNYQWKSRNTTSTDRVKGLIRQILNHPDGFTGEVLVCDNTQDIGTGINRRDNNSEHSRQSTIDVVDTFHAKGYPVYLIDWNYVWDTVVAEYSEGDANDGYTYDESTMVSYPKFRTPSGEHYVSLKHGIWDPATETYDSSRLSIINFPVLKGHMSAGASIAVKNWIGVLTTAYTEERYGTRMRMHHKYLLGEYALTARVMEVTFPELSIVDATWANGYGPMGYLNWARETRVLMASTDPVAVSWYGAKHVLTPIAMYPDDTDPDYPDGRYNRFLNNWARYLRDDAELPCTMDPGEMSVYGEELLRS